jgi:glycosyltransferase involved in cell wall biosynthesis
MRILHVCDSIVGGTGSYLAELLPPQAERYGRDNVILLIPYEQIDYLDTRLRDSGVRIEHFSRGSRIRGMAALLAAYPRTLRRFAPDVVHAHSFGAGVVTRLLKFRQRPRLVFCPHGWSTDMDISPLFRAFLEKLERSLSRNTDRVVLISHHEAKRAREMGIVEAKLVTVPNGIAEEQPAVATADWDDARLKLLFVGRLDRQKGLDILLEAVAPLTDRVALRVVGDPFFSDANGEQEAYSSVEYCGWLDRNGVASQMKACDALVVPSRWEGFGLVAVEAMRLSVPVIGSAVGGLREVLADGLYGFSVPPGDPEALRAVIAGLTAEMLGLKGVAGNRRFLESYTAARMVREIDQMYHEILAPI